MKVSVCITTFNEKKENVEKLLVALARQTLKPDEVIIVDGSTNPSIKYQVSSIKKLASIKLQVIHKKGVSRAEGRNIAIKKARNEIIATTDVGCLPRKDWLENITKPFKIASSQIPRNDTVVAGYYEMTYKQSLANFVGKNNLQKAMRMFLGVLPKNFDKNFMPSARSMAFTKTIWKKAGGFPENLSGTAEDTLFNVNLIKAGAIFTRVKNAIVEWGMPESIIKFHVTIFKYAMGDGQAGIWWHPVKHFSSHNIKILSIYLRYAIGLLLLVAGYYGILGIFIGIYILYSYRKAKLWGILLQIISDFAVMVGFARGILKRCVKV